MTSAALAAVSFSAAAATPAGADTLAGVIVCNAHLPTFPAPSGNVGTCNGTATGVHGTSALIQAEFDSTFNYTEPCPAVIGSANGTTDFNNGSAGPNFTWTRVGLTAILLLNHGSASGAAAALFIPTDPSPAQFEPGCGGDSIPIDAKVITVGVDAL
ncbi:MAG TPA: hypothetical protein VF137_09255 [Candidatus Dormibacteraeota bacterium]